MKETVSSTTLLKMVLAFTFIFSAFLALAITYNKVFRMKNESISIIEKYEGTTKRAIDIVNNYLKNNNYNTQGYCNHDEYGVASLDSNTFNNDLSQKYYYCISFHCAAKEGCQKDAPSNPNGNKIYYDFKLFYKFNLPYVGDLVTFNITGETKGIYLDDIEKQIYYR